MQAVRFENEWIARASVPKSVPKSVPRNAVNAKSKMKAIVIRHRPRRDRVFDQDFCEHCGGLGFLFCLNALDPEDLWSVDCDAPNCSVLAVDDEDPVPTSVENDDTGEVEVRLDDPPRGASYTSHGPETSNHFSGTITVKWSIPKKAR
jgi:hypothetical protein